MALNELAEKHDWQVTLLVLNDNSSRDTSNTYYSGERVDYRSFQRRKGQFAIAALRLSFGAGVIIIGHVNFVPLSLGMKALRSRAKIWMIAYGLEVWAKVSLLRLMGVRRLNRIVSISESTKTKMISKNDLSPKQFDILYPPLSPLYMRGIETKTRAKLSLPAGKMVLSVARLEANEDKGIDRIIESMPAVVTAVPDSFYVVVGDGSDRARLERVVASRNMGGKVLFTGRVSDEDLASYYAECDLFVLASPQEGFGIVFLEAMYHSKPCIGQRAGAIPEIVRHHETGLLFDAADPQGLAEALVSLLQNDALCKSMGIAGRTRLEREFSFERFKQRLEKLVLSD